MPNEFSSNLEGLFDIILFLKHKLYGIVIFTVVNPQCTLPKDVQSCSTVGRSDILRNNQIAASQGDSAWYYVMDEGENCNFKQKSQIKVSLINI